MTLVLRKSYGSWSAGTSIEMLTQPDKTRELVTVRTARRVPTEFEHIQSYSEHDKPKSIITKKDHAVFDVDVENIVERKDKTGTAVRMNRKARRAIDALVYAKRMTYEERNK